MVQWSVYKAQLVAKGYTQKEGRLDYIETFSHVAKLVTMKVLLSIVVSLKLAISYVNNAFLHDNLHEDQLYMDLPLGYKHSVPISN